MAVEVGQTLDKYELLERVGQGGMAIVYRGRDNSLRREVAIKVLHHHLAEHREARERFEREAHAVAKLRHENILEIYDFSGTESAESYIVTEFIDGQSLKEFITDQAIRYPEIGAMIALQVCKALQHAHSQGILHRDVKPENVMIRNDGVVKLTDFGIAQMIDLQRLTVTGQLLGSPAYMSPEHVNGGQLDFRTDVFAIGIMLYQLITGELPFKGKNPHEILKRIADCSYIDPRVVNPLVGKELARIINKAMARDKEDRFADISLMLAALEKFLAGSGLTTINEELGRYFDAPVPYEMALKERLVSHLTARGKGQLETDKNKALEAFNRVLTMEPDNTEVLKVLDGLGRRRKRLHILAMFAGVLLAGGFGWGVKSMLARGSGPVADHINVPALALAVPPDAAPVLDAGVPDATIVAVIDAAAIDAKTEVAIVNRRRDAGARPKRFRDAGAESLVTSRIVTLSAYPVDGTEYRLPGGDWTALGGRTRRVLMPPGADRVEMRNPSCCKNGSRKLVAGATKLHVTLPFKDGILVIKCARANLEALVDGKPASVTGPIAVPMDKGAVTTFKKVNLTLFANDKAYFKEFPVTVDSGKRKVVTCPP